MRQHHGCYLVSYNSKCLPALVQFVVTPLPSHRESIYWDVENGLVLGSDTFYLINTHQGGVTVLPFQLFSRMGPNVV